MNGLIIVGYTHMCVEGTQPRVSHDIRSPGKEVGSNCVKTLYRGNRDDNWVKHVSIYLVHQLNY